MIILQQTLNLYQLENTSKRISKLDVNQNKRNYTQDLSLRFFDTSHLVLNIHSSSSGTHTRCLQFHCHFHDIKNHCQRQPSLSSRFKRARLTALNRFECRAVNKSHVRVDRGETDAVERQKSGKTVPKQSLRGYGSLSGQLRAGFLIRQQVRQRVHHLD